MKMAILPTIYHQTVKFETSAGITLAGILRSKNPSSIRSIRENQCPIASEGIT